MSESTEGSLAWPPTKEDLERLYLEQRLSAAKIAKVYGLKYKNPKVAESTILYQLKKNGIRRRDSAEHIRKVSEALVEEWVRRYQAGESLKQIAGSQLSPVSVFIHLRKRGVRLRDKVDAQISAVTKHRRSPFIGDREDEAYLIGFARGDLNVSRHGRAVRVKTASTHPLMIEHIRRLFEPYGYVKVFPRLSRLAGYEWSVQVDLDSSFSFLLEFRRTLPQWIFRKRFFLQFVAGFFDAEGSIFLNESMIFGFETSITNSDKELLETIMVRMRKLNFPFHLGAKTQTSVWQLRMWQQDKVETLLKDLPLRHPEKVAKARIALGRSEAISKNKYTELVGNWEVLLRNIKSGRDGFVTQAKQALKSRGV